MIKTKYLIGTVADVPSMWCFGYYLKLPQQLSGQDMMIRSVFNHKDRTPSMSIFVAKKGKIPQYRFYDHSTGAQGTKIDLVMRLFNLGFVEAVDKIVEEYNEYVLVNNGDGIQEFKEHNKYQVVSWKRRKWNVLDRDYWTQYEIGSRDLEYFQAYPLDHYKLSNTENELIVSGEGIYGYFTLSGELYKIYQPNVKERKFLKVKSYYQGWDQLKGDSTILVISKSLKDILSLWTMDLGFEYLSADSETSIIRSEVMQELKHRYQGGIICLFDNDPAGEAAVAKYWEKYGVPGLVCPMEKDPSDSVKKYRGEAVAAVLKEVIINKLMEVPV